MSKINYENLMFDVTKFGGKVKIQDAYPELLPYKEISKITPEEWKIAILMVDMGSDFVRIKDPKQKMDSIFKELGLDKTGKHSDAYYDGVQQRQSNLIDACTFLIEYQNNHEFSAWYEQNKLYYELLRTIAVPLDPDSDNYDKDFDKKMSRQEKLEKMQAQLNKYETNLFGTAAMKAAAAYRSKKKRMVNWNEKFADENQVE